MSISKVLKKEIKDPILNRIKEIILDDFGGNLTAFARKIGREYNTIRSWFERESVPDPAIILDFSSKIGISPGWIFTGLDTKYLKDKIERLIPLIDWHAIGPWFLEGRVSMESKTESSLKVDGRIGVRAFACILPDGYDRMIPSFGSGNILIIDPDLKPPDGVPVLALVERRVELARFRLLGESKNLVFDNPKYPPIQLGRKARLIGTVVERREKFI